MQNSYSDYSWSFLVAAPSFSGAFFEEGVVLLLEDGEDGSFGVQAASEPISSSAAVSRKPNTYQIILIPPFRFVSRIL